MSSLRKIDLAYLAGFFDGEGCIGVYESRDGYTQLHVAVSQVDPRPLHLLVNLFGGRVSIKSHGDSIQKLSYQWRIYSKNAASALTHLLPFLVVKRSEAELAIKYQNYASSPDFYYESERQEIADKLRELKRTEFALDGSELQN